MSTYVHKCTQMVSNALTNANKYKQMLTHNNKCLQMNEF